MSGNEFGERIHNFFGEESLSQDQHQTQVVDGSWSSFNNALVSNQRQIDPSLIANLKSYSTHKSVDPERGQLSNSQHGLNFPQQPIRSEYSRSLLQEHQNPTNGYMHGNLVSQAMPNEANFLGGDIESSRDKLSAEGFPSGLHRFEMGESPVNYDFFGGQEKLNSQLPGMLQPFPRQQMTFNDMQLLKQQLMVKQMHEYQMQQQLQKQQLEARQLNSLNTNAINGNRSSDNQSHPLINGIPLQDVSSNCWQPGNTNWMHRAILPGVQGLSSGHMITPGHGQANLMAQQVEPSLYGMPVDEANTPQNSFSSLQMNRLAMQHGSANKSSSLTNQPNLYLNQVDVQDSHMLPRSTYQEKLLFSHTSVPGSDNRPNFESFQEDDSCERNVSVQEKFGKMESSGPSEKSYMKMPEVIPAVQKSTTLDPTEEKILFGSDDNLWDAFGDSIDMSVTGNFMSSSSDLYDACPSLQSGTWSALMQSAVAETTSEDAGEHEWGSKQQSAWANNNTAPHANSHIGSRAQDLGVKASNALSERLYSDSTQTASHHVHEKENKVSDHDLLEKPMAQRSQMAGNIFHSSGSDIDGQKNSFSIRKNEGIEDRHGIWKAASNPNLAAIKEQNNHFTQNLQMHRASYGAGNDSSSSRDVQGNMQQHFDNISVEKAIPQLEPRDCNQILESYVSHNAGSNETVNASELSMLPGGKETQSGHVGGRTSISRKFHYHPMGNINVTDEPCREKVTHFGQSKSHGQPAMNFRIDKGHVSQNDLNCTNEAFNGMGSDNSPSTSASADNQVKSASSRLELLHKVDQSHEHSLEKNVSGIPEATGGQFQHSQPSASQGFSLQLAPPSHLAPSSDNVQFSRNSLQPLNSIYSASVKGGISQSRFAQQSTYQGPFPGIPGVSNMTSGFPYSRGYHQNQPIPVTTRQSAANYSADSSSELSTPQVKERDECSDIDHLGHLAQTPSLLSPTTHNNKRDSAEGFPMLSASQPQQRSSSGMMADSRASISAPQHRFWNQPCKPQSDILRPHPWPSNNIEGSFSRQERTNQLSSQNGGDMSLSGKDMFSKMVQSNLQTFDHSLPSNNLPKDSLRHNEHSAVEDSVVDPKKVAPNGEQQLPSRFDCLVKDGLNQKESANHILQFGQTVSQSFSNKNHPALTGADHQQISPQMAPSWYSQYGSFNNGLVQPVNDTERFTPLKTAEQVSNMQQMSNSAPVAETPSSESLPHDATDKLLKVDQPKKRKTATSELQSWNKEVMQGPQKLKTLSQAEVDWVRATNRFAEKVEFETLFEDIPQIRSKKRLIYTTQLMQQLFSPPPARVISLVASSNYEFIAYITARAALGDACSSTSTDIILPLLSEKTKTEKISDQYISKAAEDFISRTQKLETDFTGLENGTTISDIRVEIQDLEKFAVINRFARFHPSSSDRTMSSVRLNLQRYVNIAPMPRNIPDRVQCLSL